MSWARVDDAWWSHRKVIGLDLEARGLWVSGLSYASHQRESVIPDAALALMRATPEVADRLVVAGLWEREVDGYRIHDWDDYQSTSAKRAEAGRRGGEKSGKVRAEKPEQEADEAKVLLRASKEVASTKQAQPNPTQPNPNQPKSPRSDETSSQTTRPRNLLWDAVVEECGWDGHKLTKTQKGRLASAVKELSEVGATPDEVRQRSGNYRKKYAGMDLTPNALAANWASIANVVGSGGGWR